MEHQSPLSEQSRKQLSTKDEWYAERLVKYENEWWKKLLDVQRPYRWNLRRLNLGLTLDIGCGIGRNLRNLGQNGIGVDHNPSSVQIARQMGSVAFTSEEFFKSEHATKKFDSLLFSHVAEHMKVEEAIEVLRMYLPFLKSGGKVVVITPQELGYKSDATHVEFMDFKKVKDILTALNCPVQKYYSFPFPRFMGRFFRHNEFVSFGVLR